MTGQKISGRREMLTFGVLTILFPEATEKAIYIKVADSV